MCRKDGDGEYLSFCSFVLSSSCLRFSALIVQTQLAEYWQLQRCRFLVTVVGHLLLKFATTAQAAGDWYPVGHGNWTALTCLDVHSYRNRNCMNVTGQGIDQIIQIGKDGDVADTGWPISRCSSSETLNQLAVSFLGIHLPQHPLVWYR